MELHAVDTAAVVAHSCNGALVGARDDRKAVGSLADIVVMTHPAHAAPGDTLKERMIPDIQLDLAVLAAVVGARYDAARHMRDKLAAVADTEQRDARVEDSRIVVRREGVEDAVGASCEDDAPVPLGYDLIDGDLVIRLYLGVDALLANASGDELIILAAEIED